MNTIHPIFRTKEIKNFLIDLISDYEYKKYRDLSFSDKTELAGILMKTSNDGECIVESNDYARLMNTISNSLIKGTPSAKDALFNEISETAVHYYEDLMHALFLDVYQDLCEEHESWIDNIRKYGDPDELYENRERL